MTDWSIPAWGAAVAVLIVVALLVVLLIAVRGRARAQRRVDAAETAAADLRARLDALERRLEERTAPSARTEREYVITSLGEPGAADRPPVPALPAPAFADAVLRDTVVHAAALLHGVRRGLSPEVRNRIRFEMKREVKRSRKARKAEVREALREYRARHRADLPEGPADGVVA
jgi:hypothetical protein